MTRPTRLDLTSCRADCAECACPPCRDADACISPVEAQFSRRPSGSGSGTTSSTSANTYPDPLSAPASASAATFPITPAPTSPIGSVAMVRSTSVPVLTTAEHAEFSATIISRRSLPRGSGGGRRRARPPLAGVFDHPHAPQRADSEDVEMRDVTAPQYKYQLHRRGVASLPVSPTAPSQERYPSLPSAPPMPSTSTLAPPPPVPSRGGRYTYTYRRVEDYLPRGGPGAHTPRSLSPVRRSPSPRRRPVAPFLVD